MVRRSSSRGRGRKSDPKSSGPKHRFTTYNILCSHLAGKNHFRYCKPEFLDADYRLDLIKQKLQGEVDKKAVIAIQEIGHEWAGALHQFFAEENYYFVCNHYGSRFNNYMGVGLAVPLEDYRIEEVDTKRIGDTLLIPWGPKKHWIVAFIMGWVMFIYGLIENQLIKYKLKQKPHDLWQHVKDRWNQLVTMKLYSRKTKETFWVSTYHMPCAFKNPDMMTVHASLALKRLQMLAGAGPEEPKEGEEPKEKLPYVLMGDFNFKPEDGMYTLYTTGTLETTSPAYPSSRVGIPKGVKFDFNPDVVPVRSAYVEANGEEPEYTNNARVHEMPHFMEALDYIFISDEWSVNQVESLDYLPSKEEQDEPFPNEVEPSDHVLIAAHLSL